MAHPDLPSDFEVIVIGTGLEESIIAASVARNGHNILHIDTKDYYGDSWTAFNFRGIQEWIHEKQHIKNDFKEEDMKGLLEEGEKLHVLMDDDGIIDVKERWFVNDEEDKSEDLELKRENPDQILDSLPSKDLGNPGNAKDLTSDQDQIQDCQPSESLENPEKSKDTTVNPERIQDSTLSENLENPGNTLDQIQDCPPTKSLENPEKSEDFASNPDQIQDLSLSEEPEHPDENSKIPTLNLQIHERPRPKWTKSRLIQERMFNLDLTPRLLYSRGSMVDLLIQSNISRYTEFKSVSRVLTILNGVLEHVPSSRADVFSTKRVSVVEKRILMKYLTFCLNFEVCNFKITNGYFCFGAWIFYTQKWLFCIETRPFYIKVK